MIFEKRRIVWQIKFSCSSVKPGYMGKLKTSSASLCATFVGWPTSLAID